MQISKYCRHSFYWVVNYGSNKTEGAMKLVNGICQGVEAGTADEREIKNENQRIRTDFTDVMNVADNAKDGIF